MSECQRFRQLVVTIIAEVSPVQKVNYSSVILFQTGGILPLLKETAVRENCDKFSEYILH